MNRRGRAWLFALALLMSGGLPAAAREPADDLPADTNEIRSLTPSQARRLVADFRGIEVQDHEHGIAYQHALPLNGLDRLDADTAQALAAYRNGPLLLNGLTTLTADAARSLAAFDPGFSGRNTLHLDGLTSISPEAALALAAFQGRYVSLAGLVKSVGRDTPLTAGMATLLVRRARGNALSSATQRLIGSTHGLDLSAVEDLPLAAATAIAAVREPAAACLDLGGVRELSPEVAEQLAMFPGRIVLGGIRRLSPEAAAALARKQGKDGFVSLAGLETLSPDVARVIAGSPQLLTRDFPRLEDVPPQAARALIEGIQHHPRALGGRFLDLSGLRSLPPELAAELGTNREVWIAVKGLRELPDESAVRLADYRGRLWIACPGGRITPTMLKLMHLAKVKGGGTPAIFFSLVGLDTLTPEDVSNLAATAPVGLEIGGIRRLEPTTVAAVVADLSRHGVFFRDLVTVPPAFVENRPAANAPGIRYNPDAPREFVRTANTLTAEVATAVVAIAATGQGSSLDGITAIDSRDAVQLAAMLATSPAPLALPRLRRISPKTLTALLDKHDVEIPLIETLELIPEPDGSPAEDVVIPKGFEERQRARGR